MAHLQLQLRQIPEHGGVVCGEGVAADIRHPVAEPGGTAQGLPLALPVAGDVAVALADAPHTTQGNRPPAACLAGAGAYDDMTLLPVDIPVLETAHLGGANAAVEHQAQREAHIPELRAAGSGLQFFHLFRRQRLDGLFLHGGHFDTRHGVAIRPFLPDAVAEHAAENHAALAVAAGAGTEGGGKNSLAIRRTHGAQRHIRRAFYAQDAAHEVAEVATRGRAQFLAGLHTCPCGHTQGHGMLSRLHGCHACLNHPAEQSHQLGAAGTRGQFSQGLDCFQGQTGGIILRYSGSG